MRLVSDIHRYFEYHFLKNVFLLFQLRHAALGGVSRRLHRTSTKDTGTMVILRSPSVMFMVGLKVTMRWVSGSRPTRYMNMLRICAVLPYATLRDFGTKICSQKKKAQMSDDGALTTSWKGTFCRRGGWEAPGGYTSPSPVWNKSIPEYQHNGGDGRSSDFNQTSQETHIQRSFDIHHRRPRFNGIRGWNLKGTAFLSRFTSVFFQNWWIPQRETCRNRHGIWVR